jgi:hypothetical protein
LKGGQRFRARGGLGGAVLGLESSRFHWGGARPSVRAGSPLRQPGGAVQRQCRRNGGRRREVERDQGLLPVAAHGREGA